MKVGFGASMKRRFAGKRMSLFVNRLSTIFKFSVVYDMTETQFPGVNRS